MTTTIFRPPLVYILLIILLFQGLSAILGGVHLIADPTGASLQMSTSYLEESLFDDYLIPGVILLIVLGIYPLFVLHDIWRRNRNAWFGSVIVGSALVIWIIVEILVIGYHSDPPLQLVYGITGLLILMVTFLPSIKKYLLL